MKMIPFSSALEFQKESQKAIRGTAFAESAVWAVFAASSAISILLSLSQMAPASVQTASPKATSVVCDQRNSQPV
jgi:hypothetical protein